MASPGVGTWVSHRETRGLRGRPRRRRMGPTSGRRRRKRMPTFFIVWIPGCWRGLAVQPMRRISSGFRRRWRYRRRSQRLWVRLS